MQKVCFGVLSRTLLTRCGKYNWSEGEADKVRKKDLADGIGNCLENPL
jgi:hypothetical protein